MKPVAGFNRCKEREHGKLVWNSNDSEYGLDVPVWKQTSYDVDCTNEEDCDYYCSHYDALYVNGIKGKKCYSYEVLEYICFTIDYDSIMGEYNFFGGCLKDNTHYTMKHAEKDKDYKFNDVFIEIRNKKDPVIYAAEISNYTYSFGAGFSFLATLLNICIVGCILILANIAFTVFNRRNKQGLIEKGPEVKDTQNKVQRILI
jgi:hypothetical protein